MAKEMENNTTEINPYHPFSEWMLQEIKGQYAVENERENTIGSKASAFITVIVAIITLYIPLIPLDRLISFLKSSHFSQIEKNLVILFLVVIGAGFLSMLIAFFFLLKAYGVKGYNRVKIDDLLSIANTIGGEDDCKRSQIAQGITAHYHQILRGTLDQEGNIKINSASADYVSAGIKWTVIGFIILNFSDN